MTSAAYSEPSQTSKMVLSVEIFNGFQSFTILGKNSILDVWLGSQRVSELYSVI